MSSGSTRPPGSAAKSADPSPSASSPEVQRGLGEGLGKDTPIVKHEPGGDSSHWVITGQDRFGRYKIKNTGDESARPLLVTSNDRSWATVENATDSRLAFDAEQQAKLAEMQKKADVGQGGMYVSSGYRQINPLLAAFEDAGFTPAQVRSMSFDFSAKADEVLSNWKRIAVERGYNTPEGVESWNAQDLGIWHETIKGIHRAWDDFETPSISNNTVVRGDSRHIYSAFDGILNPEKYGGVGGYHNVGKEISWPGIMSTSVGDPKTHNFMEKKTVIWKIEVPSEGHTGRVLGRENVGEAEVTFPVDTRIRVDQVLVRNDGFANELADTFGNKAQVIVFAKMLDTGPRPVDAAVPPSHPNTAAPGALDLLAEPPPAGKALPGSQAGTDFSGPPGQTDTPSTHTVQNPALGHQDTASFGHATTMSEEA